MMRLLKKARSLDLDEYRRHRGNLDNSASELEYEQTNQIASLGSDVGGFFEQVFGFTPFRYQLELAELLRIGLCCAGASDRQELLCLCFTSKVCLGES